MHTHLSSPPIPSCWGRHNLEERALAPECIRDHVNQFLQSGLAGLLTSTTGLGGRVKEAAAVGEGKEQVGEGKAEIRGMRWEWEWQDPHTTKVRNSITAHHFSKETRPSEPSAGRQLLHCIEHKLPASTRRSLPAVLMGPTISSATAVRFTSPKRYQPVTAVIRF